LYLFQRNIAGQLLLVAVLLSACTHHPDPAGELKAGLAPFTTTRSQTTQLVAAMKRSLGPADLNTLAVAYTALEEKANAYVTFMADTVRSSSFDADRNTTCAQQLIVAIDKFNKTLPGLLPPKDPTRISSAWVLPFADTIQARWTAYNLSAAAASPDAKEALLKQLRSATFWPNFEDIATEPIQSHP
jgi:hypothetical protein